MDVLPPSIAASFRAAPGAVLTTAALGRNGVARRWVTALVEEGLIERLLFGVHRDPQAAVPWDQPLHVALAYLGQRRPARCAPEVISGPAALGVMGVPGHDLVRPLVLVDERRHVRRQRSAFVLRRTDMSGVVADLVRGVPVTCPRRAVADAALDPWISDADLVNAVDDLRNRRMLDIIAAVAWWEQGVHAGARRLARLADAGVFEQESPAERDAFERLFHPDGPRPDCQVWLAPNIRVDFVYLSAGLVIEYHGGDHDRSIDRDATRIWALRRLGYEVIVVTRSMMRDPVALAREIEAIRVERQQLILEGRLRLPSLPPQPPRLVPLRTLRAA